MLIQHYVKFSKKNFQPNNQQIGTAIMIPVSPDAIYEMVNDLQLADVNEYKEYIEQITEQVALILTRLLGKDILLEMVTTDKGTIDDVISNIVNVNNIEISDSQQRTITAFIAEVGERLKERLTQEE